MRSLERRFKNTSAKWSLQSSYICFAETIKRQGFSPKTIWRWFQKLVDKNDYAKGEKKELLAHLEGLAKPAEGGQK